LSAPTEGHLAERTCKIGNEQRSVDDAMRFAELALTYCERACREAVAMAVSEFAENLVKYGALDPFRSAGTISLRMDGHQVRIRVSNNVQSHEDAETVLRMIAKISASANPMDLYRARLRELFENPGLPRAQLGLLRIAFEGGFRLSCSYVFPVLEIVAERPCRSVQ
jgi:hypothetical protein